MTSGFNGFGKDSRKTVRESFKCWNLVRLILETCRYIWYGCSSIYQMCYHDNPVNQCDYVSELIHHAACHLKGHFSSQSKDTEFDTIGPAAYYHWEFMRFQSNTSKETHLKIRAKYLFCSRLIMHIPLHKPTKGNILGCLNFYVVLS